MYVVYLVIFDLLLNSLCIILQLNNSIITLSDLKNYFKYIQNISFDYIFIKISNYTKK